MQAEHSVYLMHPPSPSYFNPGIVQNLKRIALLFFLATLILANRGKSEQPSAPPTPAPNQNPAQPSPPINWLANYHQTLRQAQEEHKFALLWFYDGKRSGDNAKFEKAVLMDPEVRRLAEKMVAVKLPVDAKVKASASDSEDVALLAHPAFAEMLGRPGIAIIDMHVKTCPQFHHVVSVYPFAKSWISKTELAVMLDLPPGTLTQRTLIWAVRTHPERPQSALNLPSSMLLEEAASHSQHQASILVQGHHNWDSRFQNINARLPAGMVAQEVCAESWPGEQLVVAAQECVHSWRQSSGHWQAVSSRHSFFGYDMKRGTNGIWYGTGIFAQPH